MSGRRKELDPRQIEFLKVYLDPKSDTYADALNSAVKAGYSEEYANVITTRGLKWLSDNIRYADLVRKALKNVEEFLNEKEDKKIKADITKFVLERLHKKRFSIRTEVEHSGSIEQIQKVDDEEKVIIDKFTKWLKKEIKK